MAFSTPTPFNQTSKRLRQHSDTDTDEESQEINHWDKFIVVTGGEPLKKLHAIAISKGIEGMAGKPKTIKRLRSGDLLVEVDARYKSENLLKTKNLAGVPVTCSPHRTLNSCKGVVRSHEAINCSEDELKEWLASQGVTSVKKITSRNSGTPKVLPLFFATFHGDTLPTYVTIGFERCRVEPFIPDPLRCFKCQGFGHHKNSCRKNEICSTCASPDHTSNRETPCTKSAQCANCNGNHPSYSKKCPIYVQEKQVQEIRVKNNVSYPEARKILGSPQKTYAAAATPTCCSVSVQTSFQWVVGDTPTCHEDPAKGVRTVIPTKYLRQSISTQCLTATKTETINAKDINAEKTCSPNPSKKQTKEQVHSSNPATSHTKPQNIHRSPSQSRKSRSKSKVRTTSPAYEDHFMDAETYSTPITDHNLPFKPQNRIEGPSS